MVPVRRVLPALLGLVLALVGAGVLASPVLAVGDGNEAACPNEASPGFRSYLPDCRGYELVTPPFKEGFSVQEYAISQDGSRVIGKSLGAFAGTGNDEVDEDVSGAVYEFARNEASWETTPLKPPASQYPRSQFFDASTNLKTTLWSAATSSPGQIEGQESATEDFYRREPNGSLVYVAPTHPPNGAGDRVSYVGGSSDLSTFLVRVEANSETQQYWKGDRTRLGAPSLYKYSANDAAEPLLVGVENEGQLIHNTDADLVSECGTELGSGERHSMYNAISADGSTIFFTALGHPSEPTVACPVNAKAPAVNELYARVDGGARTVAISEPSHEDCEECNTTAELAAAEFQGASVDGSKVFFVTLQPLLPGATGNNIYEYDFAGPHGHKVTLVSSGAVSAQVVGVTRISADGSHVYFVASGVLTQSNAEGKLPEEGGRNLYVYGPSKNVPASYRTAFIGTLGTETQESEARHACATVEQGEAEEEDCLIIVSATRVWTSIDQRAAQTTATGRFLIFASLAHMTSDDTSAAPQLFEYDAEKERLVRVSGGPQLNDGNKVSSPLEAANIASPNYTFRDSPTAAESHLAIAEDGTATFNSRAGLLPAAARGYNNVYESSGGALYLISDGRDLSFQEAGVPSSALLGMDPSGQDIFFTTADELVPQDTDSQTDFYVARAGGGSAAVSAPTGCLGDACHGPLSAPPVLVPPASATLAGAGNLAPPTSAKPRAKPTTSAEKLAKALNACREKHNKRKRASCERSARKTYPTRGSKSSRGR